MKGSFFPLLSRFHFVSESVVIQLATQKATNEKWRHRICQKNSEVGRKKVF